MKLFILSVPAPYGGNWNAISAKLLSVSSRLHFNSFYLFWEIIFIWNTNLQSTYRQILGWNKPILRQAPLPGDKPAYSRFPRLVLFHLSALSIERLKISITWFDWQWAAEWKILQKNKKSAKKPLTKQIRRGIIFLAACNRLWKQCAHWQLAWCSEFL